jgi:putative tricarboxylic transport membrane protein
VREGQHDPHDPAGRKASAEPAEPAALRSDTARQAAVEDTAGAPKPTRWLRLAPELVALCLCVVLWVPTSDFTSSVGGPGPATYPRVLIGLLALAMVVRLVHLVREIRRGAGAEPSGEEQILEEGVEFDEELVDTRKVWLAIALSVAYVFATIYLGWMVATFVFTIVFLMVTGKRNPLINVPTAFVFAFGLTYVFVKVVYISLPTGVGVFDDLTVWLFELMGIY